MHFFIIRHADPDYKNDTITEYGWQQARALANAPVLADVDAIYASSMGRAQDTARPLAEKLGLPVTVLPWAAETSLDVFAPNYIYRGEALYALKDKWYTHELCPDAPEAIEKELNLQYAGLDALLADHGYCREGDLYKITDANEKKIALFCHCGVGATLLARLWSLPANIMWGATDLCTTGITHFWLKNYDEGYTGPRCLYINDTSHLYQAGILEKQYLVSAERQACTI